MKGMKIINSIVICHTWCSTRQKWLIVKSIHEVVKQWFGHAQYAWKDYSILVDSKLCSSKKYRLSAQVNEFSKMKVSLTFRGNWRQAKGETKNKIILSMLHMGHERGWKRQHHKGSKDSKEHREENNAFNLLLKIEMLFFSQKKEKIEEKNLACPGKWSKRIRNRSASS